METTRIPRYQVRGQFHKPNRGQFHYNISIIIWEQDRVLKEFQTEVQILFQTTNGEQT